MKIFKFSRIFFNLIKMILNAIHWPLFYFEKKNNNLLLFVRLKGYNYDATHRRYVHIGLDASSYLVHRLLQGLHRDFREPRSNGNATDWYHRQQLDRLEVVPRPHHLHGSNEGLQSGFPSYALPSAVKVLPALPKLVGRRPWRRPTGRRTGR